MLYNIKISEVKRAFIALFLLFPFFGEAQVYFNKLYAPSLDCQSIVALPGGGYYTPSQIQPWTGGVGIRGLFLSSDGAIAQMDSIYEYARNHYPKGSGTTTIRNKMTYSIVGITTPDTSSSYSLIRYDNTGRIIGPHYQVNDSLRTFARSSTWRKDELVIVGTAVKHFGRTNPVGSLFLSGLDSLGNRNWEKLYHPPDSMDAYWCNSIISTSRNRLVVGGARYRSNDLQSWESYIMLTDSTGKKLKDRVFRNPEHGNTRLIARELKNGNFLVVYGKGKASNGESYYEQAFNITVAELHHATLETVWEKEYFNKPYDNIFGHENTRLTTDVINLNDSTYVISGTFVSGNYLANDLSFLFSISEKGDSLWYRDYIPNSDDLKLYDASYITDIDKTLDGGIVCSGRYFNIDSTGRPQSRGWVLKLDSIGCTEPGCDTVYFKHLDQFSFYPNPITDGLLSIEIPEANKIQILIYDLIGRLVLTQQASLEHGMRRVNLFENRIIPDGMYVIRIQSDDSRVFSAKIRIQSQ